MHKRQGSLPLGLARHRIPYSSYDSLFPSSHQRIGSGPGRITLPETTARINPSRSLIGTHPQNRVPRSPLHWPTACSPRTLPADLERSRHLFQPPPSISKISASVPRISSWPSPLRSSRGFSLSTLARARGSDIKPSSAPRSAGNTPRTSPHASPRSSHTRCTCPNHPRRAIHHKLPAATTAWCPPEALRWGEVVDGVVLDSPRKGTLPPMGVPLSVSPYLSLSTATCPNVLPRRLSLQLHGWQRTR